MIYIISLNVVSRAVLAGNSRQLDAKSKRIADSAGSLVGMIIVLFAGFATTARAQSSSSAADHLNRGVERYSKGDFEAAIADFTEAIEINSGFPRTQAKILKGSGLRDGQNQGVVATDRIVVADRFNAVAYYDRGMTWWANRDVERAIEDLNRAIL